MSMVSRKFLYQNDKRLNERFSPVQVAPFDDNSIADSQNHDLLNNLMISITTMHCIFLQKNSPANRCNEFMLNSLQDRDPKSRSI